MIVMSTQAGKGKAFRALHERGEAFIIPNPWDAGTARLLAHLGFEALATTSPAMRSPPVSRTIQLNVRP